ncbi:hypothetical protein M413DRAFT_151075 [Hebeloma cylindrosporum]|uniref:Yeast cell wall synthesis Kre9/Knh1-like N-terminal domain-containing protein n=1 Tax=Hebeloma cylindrosporum TaxID=76867 RepID=A0A0C3CBG9_HEBCY|nr:hypothetical protein M413DRAFT_151075 [Hebeloma cylindrosporum h7]
MYPTFLALVLALIFMDAALLVDAGLYVIQPSQGSTCRGGESCTITWLDDGSRPLLSAIGLSTVGLYTGKQKLVQRIVPVDVTSTHSITFKPNPAAGPNSDSYYIAITSTTLKGNDSTPYSGFSPFFSLVGMSGSFDKPLPAATSNIPIPASLTRPAASGTTKTITVGTVPNTSLQPITTPSNFGASTSVSSSSTSSRLSTSISPSSSTPTAASASASTTPVSSGSVGGASRLSLPISLFSLAIFSATLTSLS